MEIVTHFIEAPAIKVNGEILFDAKWIGMPISLLRKISDALNGEIIYQKHRAVLTVETKFCATLGCWALHDTDSNDTDSLYCLTHQKRGRR